MARERNNIFAVAADAVDLTLDTAGTIGSVVGSLMGLGNSDQKTAEETRRRELTDAADRVETSLHREAEAVKSTVKSRKAKSHPHKAMAPTAKKAITKVRSVKPKARTTAKRQAARRVTS